MTKEEKIYKECCDKIREYYLADCGIEGDRIVQKQFLDWFTDGQNTDLKNKAFMEVNVDDIDISQNIDREAVRKLIDDFVDMTQNPDLNDDGNEEKKHNVEHCPELSKKRSFIPIWAKVAAVIVPLLVLAGVWTFNNNETPQIASVTVENRVITDEFYAEKAQTKKFSLDDGTSVMINSDSRLMTTQDSSRRTAQIVGEGYFSVTKDAQRPFTVKTESLDITVLGTKFNVEAYPGREFIVVTLQEGSIALHDVKGNSWELIANHQFVYNKSTNTGEMFTLKNCDEALAWMNGTVVCNNMSAVEILNYLERKFDVKFKIDPNVTFSNSRRYTINFDFNNTLPQVLDVFSKVVIDDLNHEVNGNEIRIYKNR